MGTLDKIRKKGIGKKGHFTHQPIKAKAQKKAPKDTVEVGEVQAKTRKQEYDEYLKSDRWQELVRQCLERDSHRCRMCNKPAQVVHHRAYPEVLGTETIDDLTSLCHRCHHNYHKPPGFKEAIEEVLEGRREGINCPVCDRLAKEWKHGIASSAARGLIRLVAMYQGEPVHLDEFWTHKSGGEFSKLRFWGLIVRAENTNAKKKSSGRWSPSPLGVEFVKGHIELPAYSYVWDGVFLEHAGPNITIRDALRNRFDYE